MKFNPYKVTVGRHETFHLRYSWISKGINAFVRDANIFEKEEALVELGVGKNMVSSIKYWLRAADLLDVTKNELTEKAKVLFTPAGFDPYLEDQATLWFLHWFLASNAENATSWFYFFNYFHQSEFTNQVLEDALIAYLDDNVLLKKKPSAKSVNSDIQVMTRMYSKSQIQKKVPLEEALDSPLSELKLLLRSADNASFLSKSTQRAELPLSVIAYALVDVMLMKGTKVLGIDDLLYAKDGYPVIGSIFRLNESGLMKKLEDLVVEMNGVFEIRDTAGQYQIYLLQEVAPIDILCKHYKN